MKITVEANIDAPVDVVWRAFNNPDDIVQWDASGDWHTTEASNDLRVGGLLRLRIDSKDDSTSIDFTATYTRLEPNRLLEWRMDDDRHVRVEFFETGTGVTVRQTFDAESATPVDEQRLVWQSVLDRFTRHVAAIHRQRRHSERNMSEIAEVERSRLRALVDGDIDLARTFHHPEFQLVTPRGVALSLDEYLAEIASGSIRYLRWDPETIVIRHSQDTAVIRYRAEIEMMSDGVVLPLFSTWHTDTYERHMAHWKAVWSHATMIV